MIGSIPQAHLPADNNITVKTETSSPLWTPPVSSPESVNVLLSNVSPNRCLPSTLLTNLAPKLTFNNYTTEHFSTLPGSYTIYGPLCFSPGIRQA